MESTNLPSENIAKKNLNPIAVLKNLNTLTKIKEFDKVGHLTIPICNKHAVLSGIDKEIDPFTKEEIAKYTAIHLKNLTFEEIEIAFQNERFNLYPSKTIHYNFFSIDYFVEIITKYKAWKQSQMTIHNIPVNQILIYDATNSIENIKAIRIEFITHIFNLLQETKKDYINDAFTLYEDFIEYKLIEESSIQQKKELYAIMLKEIINETNDQKNKTFNKNLKNKLQITLNNLKDNNKNVLVANKCKAYLVCKSINSYQNIDAILKKINLKK